jgi:glycosyltransferase involved in cell wall biosynthesis
MKNRVSNITVVIAAFNAEKTIAASIGSAQRILNCSVLVVDDGSDDETARVARNSGARVMRQQNSGASSARAAGLANVNSEFVVLLDSDDQILPGMISALRTIEIDDDVVAVGGGLELANSRGATGRTRFIPERRFSTVELLDFPVTPFPPSATVWRRRLLLDAGMLAIPKLRTAYAEDYEMLIRASIVGTVKSISENTCLYTGFGGKSAKSALPAILCAERIRLIYAEKLDHLVVPLGAEKLRRIAIWRTFRSRQLEFGVTVSLKMMWASPIDLGRLALEAMRRIGFKFFR